MSGFADQRKIYLDCSKAFNTVRIYSQHTSLDITVWMDGQQSKNRLDDQAQKIINTLYCIWRPVTNGVPPEFSLKPDFLL